MRLTSNTILITGGASGIGYELTKQLTALGNTILITGRDQATNIPALYMTLNILRHAAYRTSFAWK